MKYFIIILLQATLSLGLWAQTADKAEDRIRENRRISNLAFKEHGIHNILQYLTKDVVIITANGTLLSGKESVENYLKLTFSQNDIYFIRKTKKVILSEDKHMAWEMGIWTGLRPNTKNWKNVGGNYSAVWIKVNNDWKIRSEQFMQTR